MADPFLGYAIFLPVINYKLLYRIEHSPVSEMLHVNGLYCIANYY